MATIQLSTILIHARCQQCVWELTTRSLIYELHAVEEGTLLTDTTNGRRQSPRALCAIAPFSLDHKRSAWMNARTPPARTMGAPLSFTGSAPKSP